MEYELKLKDVDLEAPDEDDDPHYPTLKFEGVCRGAHSSNGLVEGSVGMFAGVIRWNFVSNARFAAIETDATVDGRSTRSPRTMGL